MKASSILVSIIFVFSANLSFAAPLSLWSSGNWQQFANDDGVGSGGYVNPGWGGQSFDAEYLYYKVTGNVLSVGLQTGFDVVTGKVTYGGTNYYAGDLALSFNNGVTLGNASTYEYAIDFGLLTKDISQVKVDAGSGTGIDAAGLYSVSAWNNNISFGSSAPFAMDAGSLVAGLLSNSAGQEGTSFYRMVSFDLAALGLNDTTFLLDAHWTMSCGNDAIDGQFTATAPEPKSLYLLLTLLLAAWTWSVVPVFSKRRIKSRH